MVAKTSKNVLVVGKIHESGMKILESDGALNIEVLTDPSAEIPREKVEASDAVLIRYGVLSKEDIAHAENLKVVSRHGVGCDNLPVNELAIKGVPVTIVGPVNAISVAELTLAMLLALSKKIAQYDSGVRNGNWNIRDTLGASELSSKKMLLLGFGRIGREVARRAQAFDMVIDIYDPFVSEEDAQALGVNKVSDWKQALGDANVISLHLPMIPETKHIIDAAAFEAMKPTAILLNLARGGLIDEEAMYQALSGRMAAGGAGIDTFEQEPLSPDAKLLTLNNIVVSPHSAALTEEAAKRMGEVAALNVIAGLRGKLDPALVFNLKQLSEWGHSL